MIEFLSLQTLGLRWKIQLKMSHTIRQIFVSLKGKKSRHHKHAI